MAKTQPHFSIIFQVFVAQNTLRPNFYNYLYHHTVAKRNKKANTKKIKSKNPIPQSNVK